MQSFPLCSINEAFYPKNGKKINAHCYSSQLICNKDWFQPKLKVRRKGHLSLNWLFKCASNQLRTLLVALKKELSGKENKNVFQVLLLLFIFIRIKYFNSQKDKKY